MTLRVERVDPARHADEAALILNEAWRSDCLHYSPAYLLWQCRSPGRTPPRGVLALDGEKPAGFAAIVPRILTYDGKSVDAGLLSFVGVRPPWQGAGLAGRLYRELLAAEDEEADRPIISFAVPGSAGHRVLSRGLAEAGYKVVSLGIMKAHAFAARPRPGIAGYSASPAAGVAEASAAMPMDVGPRTIRAVADPEVIAHWLDDPRGRAVLVAFDPGGEALGIAAVARLEVRTSEGIQVLTTLSDLSLSRDSPQAAAALFQSASAYWAGRVTSPTVLAPNLGGLDSTSLRAFGVRTTGSAFEGFVASRDVSCPLLEADGTNLDVV